MNPSDVTSTLLPASKTGGLRNVFSWQFLVKAAVSVGIVVLLLSLLPAGEIFTGIKSVPLWVWLGVLAGFAAGHAVAALKWRLLITATKVSTSKKLVLKAHAAGLFANLCLPSIVGGDFVRAALVARQSKKIAELTVASLADRLIDTFVLLLIAVAALLLLPDSVLQSTGQYSGLLSVVVVISMLGLIGVIGTVVLIAVIDVKYYPNKVQGIVTKIKSATRAMSAAPGFAISAFVISIIIQSGFILLNVLLAQSMGIDLPVLVWFVVWPVAKLIALVPISLGGLGVRDAALMSLLVPFGVPAATAVAQSLSWQAVLWATGLIAGATLVLQPLLDRLSGAENFEKQG